MKNNKGFIFNLTIVLMIVVSFIIGSVLVIVMANLDMQRAEKQVQSSYYDTENDMNVLMKNIEDAYSEKLKTAYNRIIKKLNGVTDKDTFNKQFRTEIVRNKEWLISAIDANKYEYSEINIDYAELKGIIKIEELKDKESKIKTDIEITIPDIFSSGSTGGGYSENFMDYVLIAGSNINISDSNKVDIGGSIRALDLNVINCSLNINSENIILGGSLKISENREEQEAVLIHNGENEYSNIYANECDINVDKNSLISLKGNTYIAGNTKLSGEGTLQLEGGYWGYTPNTENEGNIVGGSIIDVNNILTLDMSGLNTLWLSGTHIIDNKVATAESLLIASHLDSLYKITGDVPDTIQGLAESNKTIDRYLNFSNISDASNYISGIIEEKSRSWDSKPTIKIGENTEVITPYGSHILTSVSDGNAYNLANRKQVSDKYVKYIESNIATKYENLKGTLQENKKSTQDIFEELIKSDLLPSDTYEVYKGIEVTTNNVPAKYTVILGTGDLEINGNNINGLDVAISNNKVLIIANGDVTILNGIFDGNIISSGNINIEGNCKLNSDNGEVIRNLLNKNWTSLKTTDGKIIDSSKLRQIFKIEDVPSDDKEVFNSMTVQKLIQFKNWTVE